MGITSGVTLSIVVITVFLFIPSNISVNEIEISQNENNPVVAEINDKKIRLDEIKDAVNMEISQGQTIDREIALERMIAKILLFEESQARNITITPDEVDEEIISMYTQSGLSKTQFEEKLKEIGTSYDQILQTYREELIINKMLSDEISKTEIQISDEEAKLVFEENKDTILTQIGEDTVFEDISSQIKATLLQQKQQKIALDIIEHLKEKSVIVIYEDRLQ